MIFFITSSNHLINTSSMTFINDETREETFIADMNKGFFDGLNDDDREYLLMYLRVSEVLSNKQRELIADKLGLELVS